MALELANARMRDKWLKLRELVEWGCQLLRRGPPTEGERLWQRASIAVAEGALDSEVLFNWQSGLRTLAHASQAQQRFPSDARIASLQRFAVQSPTRLGSATVQPGLETGLDEPARTFYDAAHDTAVRKLTPLFNDPEVGAEAALRVGHLQLIQLRFDQALAALDVAARRSQTDYVTYLAYISEGPHARASRQT